MNGGLGLGKLDVRNGFVFLDGSMGALLQSSRDEVGIDWKTPEKNRFAIAEDFKMAVVAVIHFTFVLSAIGISFAERLTREQH